MFQASKVLVSKVLKRSPFRSYRGLGWSAQTRSQLFWTKPINTSMTDIQRKEEEPNLVKPLVEQQDIWWGSRCRTQRRRQYRESPRDRWSPPWATWTSRRHYWKKWEEMIFKKQKILLSKQTFWRVLRKRGWQGGSLVPLEKKSPKKRSNDGRDKKQTNILSFLSMCRYCSKKIQLQPAPRGKLFVLTESLLCQTRPNREIRSWSSRNIER